MIENPFEAIDIRLAAIEAQLQEIVAVLKPYNDKPYKGEQYLSVEEAASFLHVSKGTMYKISSDRRIPVSSTGKRIYFLKDDLVSYINKGRRKSIEEIEQEANEYIFRNCRKF